MTNHLQYDIVIAHLDATVGRGIKKNDLIYIVSYNEMNMHLATVVVCPITSHSRSYPTRIGFELEGQENWIVIDQIRMIDQIRITNNIGKLDVKTIEYVKDVIKEAYVD